MFFILFLCEQYIPMCKTVEFCVWVFYNIIVCVSFLCKEIKERLRKNNVVDQINTERV